MASELGLGGKTCSWQGGQVCTGGVLHLNPMEESFLTAATVLSSRIWVMLLHLVPPPGPCSPVLTAAEGFCWALPQPGTAALQSFAPPLFLWVPPLFPEQKQRRLFLFLMRAPAPSVVWQRGRRAATNPWSCP